MISKELSKTGITHRISDETINNIIKNLNTAKTNADELATEFGNIRDMYKEFMTLFNEGQKVYSNKYGQYVPLDGSDNLDAIKTMNVELDRSYSTLNKRVTELKGSISTINGVLAKLNEEKTKYDTFIKTVDIRVKVEGSCPYDDTRTFAFYKTQYDLACVERDIAVKDFAKEVIRLIDETEGFTVRNFRDDLSRIKQPEKLTDVQKLAVQLSRYLEILDLQISKTQLEIDKIKELKDNYVKQCIQTGEWVYRQLLKLNALSRIKIPGFPAAKEMVQIDLKEFEEETKYARMDNHINHLLNKIDIENMTEQEISKELSSKSLLAQVSDIENASVRLYKVEDIIENSRPIRWENAEESDGQSNAIYFVFLASVISFIRTLSTGNMDTSAKKVLIVDNPFGSTSAVYLWRVMFEMLSQNNIQLISPGHNISKEVLPFFDVNYIFTEEILRNGKKKVVVSDFRGDVDKNGITDEFINTEQLSLF